MSVWHGKMLLTTINDDELDEFFHSINFLDVKDSFNTLPGSSVMLGRFASLSTFQAVYPPA